MKQELVLHGIFLFLVRNGVRLSVRDYGDALKMLRAGYGIGTRENLFRLCKTLWARSDEDIRLLDLLFQQFKYPTSKETLAVTRKDEDDIDDIEPDDVDEIDSLEDYDFSEEEQSAVPAIQFVSARQQGLGLHRAQIKFTPDEAFILVEQPVITLRYLIIAWRRFRVAMRGGPKIEFDLSATIAEQCRRGNLEKPVFISARGNQAKLIVLIDVSNSMTPWRRFNHFLANSLNKGQLGYWAIYYFHNVPGDFLYQQENLSDPVPIEQAAIEHPGASLLIISDAGAARGFQNRERVTQTGHFISRIREHWRPIAWANTLPKNRWQGSSAEMIGRISNVTMLEFNEEGLTQAIDVLRGCYF